MVLQILQEVLETPGPATTHDPATEGAVSESEIEVEAGHEPNKKVNSIAIQAIQPKRNAKIQVVPRTNSKGKYGNTV